MTLTTPIFDIDSSLGDYGIIKNITEIIVSELGKYGISKIRLFKIVWKRNTYIHIHEKDFSERIRKSIIH